MRTHYIRVGLKSENGIFSRRKFGHRPGEHQVTNKKETVSNPRTMKVTHKHQRLGDRQETVPPWSVQSRPNPLVPWSGASGLLNCKCIGFCCFRLLDMRELVPAILRNTAKRRPVKRAMWSWGPVWPPLSVARAPYQQKAMTNQSGGLWGPGFLSTQHETRLLGICKHRQAHPTPSTSDLRDALSAQAEGRA